jgi:6-pyruvoyltetrahydropterin/6-carboxytetrahydropterin synthase
VIPALRTTLRLAKADFKFSAAHFTLFGAREAERLHGHNYRVTVEVAGAELDAEGLLVETSILKRRIRELCAELDDRVLLPDRSPHLGIERSAEAIDCRYADRAYRFPAREVLLLPAVNITMELLARLFWERLAADLAPRPRPALVHLAVEIEETDGQSARVDGPLAAAAR